MIVRDRTLALQRAPADRGRLLYNTSWRLMGEGQTRSEELAQGVDRHAGTHVYVESAHRWEWRTADQLLVSAGLLRAPTPVLDESSVRVHYLDEWFAGDGVCASPSDHLPLAFSLQFLEE